MRTSRRVIIYAVSLMLALLMVTAGSAAAFATEELTPIFETNPLYPEYIPAETAPILNSGEDTAIQSAATLDEAAVILRKGLEDRSATVTIALEPGYTPVSEDAYYVWNTALEETGVPTQGDYIRWHWASWGCDWDYEWTGSAYRYFMIFTPSYYTTSAQETELTAAVNGIIDGFGFTSTTSDYEKVRTIHGWVTDNITYDYTGSGTMKQTAYNGIMEGTCVCQGYSSIMYRMLWQVGVPARIIPGDTNATPASSKDDVDDNHGWNIVKLGDLWYNLDATWDAGSSEENWDYFLTCSDSFTGHYRWPDYDTDEFHSQYPMAEADYAIIASGTCGENLSWTFDAEGTLTIFGTGEMQECGYWDEGYVAQTAPWYDSCTSYGELIKSVVIKEGVTSIGNYAFYDYYGYGNLANITFPSSLTNIGDYAFYRCALTELTLSDGVEAIGAYAFSNCDKLTSILIPASVTSIGDYAFNSCDKLEKFEVDDANPNYSSDSYGVLFNKDKTVLIQCPTTFSGKYSIPNSVAIIGNYAFAGCDLTEIVISEGVTHIGDGAFSGCTSITDVVLPDSVIRIGEDAFNYCINMVSIDVGDSVTSIGDYAFYECKITSIDLPDSITDIGAGAFASCWLTSINIPNGITVINGSTFFDCSFESIDIPDSVTTIDGWVFANCYALKSITIPKNVDTIGEYAFSNCESLTVVRFEGNAPSIDEDIFLHIGATAYYPDNNETWTSAVKKDYGGDITWVAYTPEPEIEKFDFAGSTMTLGNTLEINFVINNSDIQGEGNYVVITKQYADERGLVEKTIPQTEWKNYGASGKYVSFTVSAKEMNDQLTAAVYNAEGVQISNVYYDSVAGYCVRMLGKEADKAAPDTKKMALYVDMVNYGAAAQNEWSYNVENLANAALTEEQKALATVVGKTDNVLVKGTGYAGTTLSLKENILLNIVYQNATIDQAAYAVVSFTDHYGNADTTTIQASQFQPLNSSMKYVQITTLAVADGRQPVTVELYDADGNVISTTVESIESYIARNDKALHDAIMAFCVGAYNSFH